MAHNSLNDLADVRDVILRNDVAALGLFRQHINMGDKSKRKGLGALRTVAGNISNNVPQIITGERRPNQFVSHEASWRLISS